MTDAIADPPETLAPAFQLQYGHFRFGPCGMEAAPGASFDEWAACGEWLRSCSRQMQLWVGDHVNYGRDHYGELAEQGMATDVEQQIAEATGWKPQTIDQYARVARQVAPSRRDPDLPFAHHREVADKSPAEQTFWLARAKNENMSTERLRLALKAEAQPDAPQTVWLVISCSNQDDREALASRMRLEGREVKEP